MNELVDAAGRRMMGDEPTDHLPRRKRIAMDTLQPLTTSDAEMGALKTANHLIGDPAGLAKAWEEDGYWYFKGLFDKDVIADLRKSWIAFLQRKGLIDEGVDDNKYNGSGFESKDITPAELTRIAEFNEMNIHTMLTKHPATRAAMERVLGYEPMWLPIAEYRANAPVDDPNASRIIYAHQDGFYSRGLDMKICWIPLDDLDAEVGCCAFVPGTHKGQNFHDLDNPPLFPVRKDNIPPMDQWQYANFQPGDVVIFDLDLLHSGLTNVSKDRFRLSFDIRIIDGSDPRLSIGKVCNMTDDAVTIRDEKSGERRTFSVDPDTFIRSTTGLKQEDLKSTFRLGETVIINSMDGKLATLVRAIH